MLEDLTVHGYDSFASLSSTGSKRMKRDSTDSKSSCSQTASTPLSYNASVSNLTSPSLQPLQSTRSPSVDCPTLKNLLTQNKAPSSNPASAQSTPSVVASPEPSGIPTVVRDSRDSWSPISQQSNDCVSTTHFSHPSLRQEFSSPANQHQSWSEQQNGVEQSFTQMLQNPNFSHSQLQEFSQNPTLSGSTFQNNTVSSAFDDNSAASLYNATESQPLYFNVGSQLDTVELTDPSMTQLPTEVADHTIIMNFILCGLPSLPKDDRLKLLHILQKDCQEEKTKLTEDQQTTDDQVTSSSSGPGGFTIE